MRNVWLGLAVAAAMLGVAIYLRGEDPRASANPRAAAVQARSSSGKQSPEMVLAIAPGAGAAAVTGDTPKRSPLMQELLAATGWRAIYDRLRDKPARTGEEDYVLARILEYCGIYAKMASLQGRGTKSLAQQREEFLQGVVPSDPQRVKRIAAYDRAGRLAHSCEGFDDVKATREDVRALLERAAASGEPKAQASLVEMDVFAPVTLWADRREGASARPQISAAQIDVLQRAAASGDPSAIETAGRVFASTIDNLVVRDGADGLAVDPRAFHDAWLLAACEFGLDCGAEHRAILQGCAYRGNCGASSLREHMFYYEHSPRQSQLINEYHANLVNAIRSGDWGRFTFQHGARPTGGHYMFGRAGP